MYLNKPVITITGTNGKGSCAAICEAILLAQGYKIGCYTSPHLIKFNERIRVNGQAATDEDIKLAYLNIGKNLGYFEQATLAALEIFKSKNLDAYILEVGIGGRLDPVNRIEPDISVITSIDLDHQDRLGNTREEIGFEKAHIFRSGKPAICGDKNIPESVIKYAKKIKADLTSYQQDYFYEINQNNWKFWNKNISYENLPIPDLYIQNAAIALQALSYFPLPISRKAINPGLKKAYLSGRFQIIDKPVLQIFDVAHNAASAKLLAQRLELIKSQGKTIAVIGMLKDKDIAATISPLLPWVDIWHAASIQDPRGASSLEMAKFLPESEKFDSPILAYQAALKKAGPEDRVVVFGSFRTVGEILSLRVV
jgi:dihydrofolate synthase/folylpolyglutamate synthase